MLISLRVIAAAVIVLASAPTSAQRAEILWDGFGIPHIYADATEDLFYGFGWAQMESHGDALLRLYGLTSGSASEYWGEDLLENDRLFLTVSGGRMAQRMIDAQSPEMRRYLRSFIDGINAYADAHPERIADSLHVVLPITERHVAGRMTGVFLLFSNAARQAERWIPGSNAWAVSAPKSAGEAALLLANPHLPYSDEFRFFEAHLSGPGGDIYGVTLLGLPVISLGFNNHLGWTHTVNTLDFEDFYELRLEEDGYVFDDEVRRFEVDTTVLRVRSPEGGFDTDTLVTRRSIHGPVISASGDRALAWRTPPVEGAIDQWWQMGTATDVSSFEEALSAQQIVGFTTTYADRDGNILHHAGAALPERSTLGGQVRQGVIRGDISSTLWTDIHDYHDLPRVMNPASGWVQNTNEASFWAAWPLAFDLDDFPERIGSANIPFRTQRSMELLESSGPLTLDGMIELLRDSRLAVADRILPELIAAAREHGGSQARRAADVLEAWDRTVEADSRGAVLFQAWYFTLAQSGAPIFAEPWNAAEPRATPRGLADPVGAVAVLEAAAQQVEAQAGALDVPWGTVNRLRLLYEDFPASGGPGALGAFRVFNFQPDRDGRRTAVHGDTFVLAVEFGERPRAQAVLVYGNATQAGSPHLTDQIEMAARGELRPVWFTREDVEANHRSRTLLD